MPRGNVERQQQDQRTIGSKLLSHPVVAGVIEEAWKEFNGSSRVASLTRIARHIDVNTATLSEKARKGEIESTRSGDLAPYEITKSEARKIIKSYAARIAGWKKATVLGEELGMHRNYVDSYLQRSGRSAEMFLAADHVLYISPEGEQALREHACWLEELAQRESLTDFIKRTKNKRNHVTAYFSARQIQLDSDQHGHVRLTEEQKQSFLDWKLRVKEHRTGADIVRDGQVFRPIRTVAEEKAALLAKPGTRAFARIAKKEESALSYHAKQGHPSIHENRSVYIPAESALQYRQHLQIEQAARLLYVSKSTIREWTRKNPAIIAEHFDGRSSRGVDFFEVIEHAMNRYEIGPKLGKRSQVPGAFASMHVHDLCDETGAPYSRVIDFLPISDTAKRALVSRVRRIPRAVNDEIQAVFDVNFYNGKTLEIPKQIVTRISDRAALLGLSSKEFAVLATGKPQATVSSSISNVDFLDMLPLAVHSKKDFLMTPVVPATHVRIFLDKQAIATDLSSAELLSRGRIDESLSDKILHSEEFLTGAQALKVIELCRKGRADLLKPGGTSARQVASEISKRASRLGVKKADCVSLLPVSTSTKQAILKSTGHVPPEDALVLDSFMLANDHDFLMKLGPRMPLFPVERLESDLEQVATVRGVEKENIRGLLSRAHRGDHYCIEGDCNSNDTRVLISAIMLLDMLKDPTRGVSVYGELQDPAAGDVFIHSESSRFGLVTRVGGSTDLDRHTLAVQFIGEQQQTTFGL